jgi:hypothetical protein
MWILTDTEIGYRPETISGMYNDSSCTLTIYLYRSHAAAVTLSRVASVQAPRDAPHTLLLSERRSNVCGIVPLIRVRILYAM